MKKLDDFESLYPNDEINTLRLRNKLASAFQCRYEFSINNVIDAFNIVSDMNHPHASPLFLDDEKSSWIFLKFWLTKYDICNLLNISMDQFKALDRFYDYESSPLSPTTHSRYKKLCKELKLYYETKQKNKRNTTYTL